MNESDTITIHPGITQESKPLTITQGIGFYLAYQETREYQKPRCQSHLDLGVQQDLETPGGSHIDYYASTRIQCHLPENHEGEHRASSRPFEGSPETRDLSSASCEMTWWDEGIAHRQPRMKIA